LIPELQNTPLPATDNSRLYSIILIVALYLIKLLKDK